MRHTLPLVFYMLLMWILSSIPGNNNLPLFPGLDKVIHITEYFIFGLLLLRTLSYPFKEFSYRKVLIFYCLFSLFWAVSDEFHQFFVPMRQMDILDIVADMVGVLIAFSIFKKNAKSFAGGR